MYSIVAREPGSQALFGRARLRSAGRIRAFGTPSRAARTSASSHFQRSTPRGIQARPPMWSGSDPPRSMRSSRTCAWSGPRCGAAYSAASSLNQRRAAQSDALALTSSERERRSARPAWSTRASPWRVLSVMALHTEAAMRHQTAVAARTTRCAKASGELAMRCTDVMGSRARSLVMRARVARRRARARAVPAQGRAAANDNEVLPAGMLVSVARAEPGSCSEPSSRARWMR